MVTISIMTWCRLRLTKKVYNISYAWAVFDQLSNENWAERMNRERENQWVLWSRKIDTFLTYIETRWLKSELGTNKSCLINVTTYSQNIVLNSPSKYQKKNL